ncbi:MAG: M48 family metalloprotease [Candidatus Aminicenantes bacterium]|nr:M48 family metalloprotease [Candidatus Aminicenantes bacterium]
MTNQRKIAVIFFLSCLLMARCASLKEEGQVILSQVDQISEKDKKLITMTGETLRTSFQDLTDEEEYYLGRSVSALILSRYKVWDNQNVTNYLNLLTQALCLYSERPEIFAGYHVLPLDSEEINALAAPGGFIFVTRGLLRLCLNEDTLAGIIAHEIGHISARHGLQAIKKSRLLEAFKLLATETAERLAPDKMAQLTNLFEGALDDILIQLVERGYDRRAEDEADELALKTLKKAGYSPLGFVAFIEELARQKTKTSGLKGWFSTHPDPQERLKKIKKEISTWGKEIKISPNRLVRFQKITSTWK